MTPVSENRHIVHHVWRRDEGGRGLVLASAAGVGAGVSRRVGTLHEFPAQLTPREADLLDIATAVFGSDRLAPRPPSDGRSGEGAHFLNWRREIRLEVPVRDLDFWAVDRNRAAIERTLAEMTDDTWQLTAYQSDPPAGAPRQLRLFRPVDGAPVALFSGGLDSLAGTLAHFEAHRRFPWLVSVASLSHTVERQRALVAALAAETGVMPEHIEFSVHNSGVEVRELGKRQRARSFLYLVLAALVARRVEATEVQVLENGVTSLNVPLSPFLTSTRVTRTTHPLVLLTFEALVREVLEWPAFRLTGPHLFETKAEMVRPIRRYASLIAQTESCARVRTGEWCGTCTACILRRQVLWEAGAEVVDHGERARYGTDIFARYDAKGLDAAQRWYFLATIDHVSRILHSPQSLLSEPSVVRVIAALCARGDRDPNALGSDIVRLHQRYADEWVRVLDRARADYPGLTPLWRQFAAPARDLS
jgi:7-cyano-7-deazaguanine synthase in queuosine biosynthesis